MVRILETISYPCAPINTVDQVFEDSQVLAREMLVDIPHPNAGTVSLIGTPLKIPSATTAIPMPPLLFVEHTDGILKIQ
jgi:formyl-CoA transferase